MHTSEDFIASFTAENHLHTHSFDLSTEKVHGCTRSDRGDIVGFKMVDDFRDGVKTFLDGKDVFVVNGTQEVGGFSGCNQIGRVLETNGERMKLRPCSNGS